MKFYEKAELEVIKLRQNDIITTSGKIEEDDSSNDGEWID